MNDPDTTKPGVLFVSSMTRDPDGSWPDEEKWNRLARDHDVRVVCFSRAGFGRFDRAGCRFYGIPRTPPLLFRVLLYYLLVPGLATVLHLRAGVSTWIAQGPYEAASVWLPRLLLGGWGNPRLVVEAHGNWIESFIQLRSPPAEPLVRRLLGGFSRLVLWNADGFRSISSSTEALLRKHTRNARPHFTFPTYTDLGVFLRTEPEEKHREQRDQILYAGALTRLKGVYELVEALAEVLKHAPGLRLRLCGEGPERSRLREMARDRGIESKLQLPGRLNQRELREEYVRSKLLVLPSRTEGLGRVLLEAMACFTPVVATRTGGGTEIVETSKAGLLVPVEDPEELAAAITQLLEDPRRRTEMGRRGRRYVEESHDPDRYFRRYRRMIREIQPPRPG